LSTPAKEDKKKAQLRNYTIAGGRGVQHELPLGVSWKDLKAILASSNAPTTERMVKSLPLPREYVCTTPLSLSLFRFRFRFVLFSLSFSLCLCQPFRFVRRSQHALDERGAVRQSQRAQPAGAA